MQDIVFYTLIGILILSVVALVFSKPLKLILKAILNSVIGLFAFIGMNFLLTPIDLFVGINALTLLIVGILGIPGFIILYLCQWLL